MDALAALAAAFPPAAEAEWRRLAAKALKGADPETLVRQSEDGIPVLPLYPLGAAGRALAGRPAGAWRIAQRIDHPDPQKAARLARDAAGGGADTLDLVWRTSPAAHGAGLAAAAAPVAPVGIAGAPLLLRLDAGEDTAALARRAAGPADRVFDPLATLAAHGRLARSPADHFAEAVADRGADGRLLAADGRVWHAAGATAADELGLVLAALVAELRLGEAAGADPADFMPRIGLVLAADADLLETVAKLRAARLLHARLAAALGLPPAPAHIHAETAWRMTTRRDPDGNILRHGIAAFAAALGGADGITVLPHTAAIGLADAAAARIARNTLLVLADEAHLGRVADPAAGSGAVEALTDALARAAWARMQALEGEGGLLAALRAGAVQARLAAAAAERAARVAAGAIVLVGSTRYAADLPPAAVEPFPPASAPAAGAAAETVAPLVPAPVEPDRPAEAAA